ncbi:MAG: hypothetical protein K1X67_10390 [Fimbriimonadaceae bacterium]|nr:hypothetical protein [Fimbriimonadaceae bacterium]
MIEICWLRIEDEYDSPWGESILLLPDQWLAEAYALYGSLKPDIEARCDIGDGVCPDEDLIDNEDGNERLAWTYNLQLLAFAVELQDLSVSDLAEKLGTGASTTPYADTMRILRRRNREFELLQEEVEATLSKKYGSTESGVGIRPSIFERTKSAHRKFLVSGTIDYAP